MTIAHDFAYLRPATVPDALAMLADHRGAMVLAGGTDVVPWLRDDAITPETVVDIKDIAGFDAIDVADGVLRIGPLVTFSDLIASPVAAEHVPALVEASHTVASVGVRNRATVVGNICSAVPSCDAGPPLLVYEAAVEVAGPGGERSIPVLEWFLGPRTQALAEGELVTGITIPLPGAHGGCYAKLSRYRGEDLAQVGVAVLALPGNDYRVAFGAVGPVPFRAPAIEERLAGGGPGDADPAALDALVDEAISPIDDVRASKEYRTHMSRVMLRRSLAAAAARLDGGGPPYGEQVI
ncbi:MAG: xanthine dehydrogenase family protein subunit M [Actinobacteria bacterium]|nr:xanthine dehydrogenase family protein subunit M [Actinomycetota bacterium]